MTDNELTLLTPPEMRVSSTEELSPEKSKAGACRDDVLCNLLFSDVITEEDIIFINIRTSNNDTLRKFVIMALEITSGSRGLCEGGLAVKKKTIAKMQKTSSVEILLSILIEPAPGSVPVNNTVINIPTSNLTNASENKSGPVIL